MAPAPIVEGGEPRSVDTSQGKKDRPMTFQPKGRHGASSFQQSAPSPQPSPTRPPQGAGPPSRPGGPPSGPPQQGPPQRGPPQQGPPQQGPHEDKHCFKNAGGTEICVAKQWDQYNNTKVFDKDGTYDRHNDYGDKENKDVAGNVPGTNVTEALQGGRESHDGNTMFQVHNNEDNSGFRDTHSQNWDGKQPNSGPPQYDDHKEDFGHKNQEFEEHSSQKNGDRTDMKNQGQTDNKDLTDVHDQNGETDTTNINNFAGDWLELFHKHHGADGNDWRKDSSVTKHANVSNKHQQEEQTGKDGFYEFLEQDRNKGSFNFHVNGNDAWKDLAEETSNFPKNFTEVHRRSEIDPTTGLEGGIVATQDRLTKQIMKEQHVSQDIASKALIANVLGSAKSTMCLWSANSTVLPSDTWTDCFREADASGQRILDSVKHAYFTNLNVPAEAHNNAGPMLQYAYTEALMKLALNNQTFGNAWKHNYAHTDKILAEDIKQSDNKDKTHFEVEIPGSPDNFTTNALQRIRGSMKMSAAFLSSQGAMEVKKIGPRDSDGELVEPSLHEVPVSVLEALGQLSSPDAKTRESAMFKLLQGKEVVMSPFSIDKEVLGKLRCDNTSVLNIAQAHTKRSIDSTAQGQIPITGVAQLANQTSCSQYPKSLSLLGKIYFRNPPKALIVPYDQFVVSQILMVLFCLTGLSWAIPRLYRDIPRLCARRAAWHAAQAEEEEETAEKESV